MDRAIRVDSKAEEVGSAVNLTNSQSLNRYAYVGNNPTTLTDPSGLGPQHPPSCTTMTCAWQYYCGTLYCGYDSTGLITGPGWDEFGLQQIPVVVQVGWGYIPVFGGPWTPGPQGSDYASRMQLWGYWGPIYEQTGDAFTILGEPSADLTGPTPIPPSQQTQPPVTKPPGPDKWWPSTDPSSCSVYAPGSLPGWVCSKAPSTPRMNSIRGCLQQFYISGYGYIPFATIGNPNFKSLVPVDQRVGFGEHAYCLPEGFFNP
jgi:hypothetical protein